MTFNKRFNMPSKLLNIPIYNVVVILKVGSEWPEPLNTQKEKLMVQLQKLQNQVRHAYLQLQRSSIFNAEMFLKVYAVTVQ